MCYRQMTELSCVNGHVERKSRVRTEEGVQNSTSCTIHHIYIYSILFSGSSLRLSKSIVSSDAIQ